MPKYLVTGGTGFVGANLVRELVRRGGEVHITRRQASLLWRIEDIQDKITLHILDLADAAAAKKLVLDIKPDVIFHCAAEATNPGAMPEEEKVVAGNLKATSDLADAALQIGAVFINTGSSSEYGIKDAPMKEGDALEPVNVYGRTKAAATTYVSNLAKRTNASMLTLRLFSVYGYYEDARRLIPALTLALIRQKRFRLLPEAVRDFVFIEDVVDAYIYFAEKAKSFSGEVFNVGTGKTHTAQQVLDGILTALHNPTLPGYDKAEPKQLEPKVWVADISKTAAAGWRAKFQLEEGLQKTADWFEKNQHLYPL